MSTPNEEQFPSLAADEDELVRRLRALRWPMVGAEVRDRCWTEFERRLRGVAEPANDDPETGDDGNPPHRNALRRESFTRRVPLGREPLTVHARGHRPWAERRLPERVLTMR